MPPDACPMLPSRALIAWARTALSRSTAAAVARDWWRWRTQPRPEPEKDR
jgi:hypothetical protein